MHANMFDLHIYCALRRNSANKGFELWIPMARQEFNRRKRRFNFCTSPGFEPEPRGVTGYLLLVSHPSPKFRVINHPGTLTRATPPLDEELRPRRGRYESRVIKSGRTPAGLLQLDKGVGVFGQKIHTGIQCFTVFNEFFFIGLAQIINRRQFYSHRIYMFAVLDNFIMQMRAG